MNYLSQYPIAVQQQAERLLKANELAPFLLDKYPKAHGLRSDAALFDYVGGIKQEFLRGSDAINKVLFDAKIHVVKHALGTHTTISRVQGKRLVAKHEIRIAALFKDAPLLFLRMITVHELAHLKERNHDKAFYKLCTYMEPNYHQLELDMRLYLTHLETTNQRLWG